MLVIFRREGEPLYIGQSIKITVERITADGVKLVIDAPREIEIHRHDYKRDEAYEKNRKGNKDGRW